VDYVSSSFCFVCISVAGFFLLLCFYFFLFVERNCILFLICTNLLYYFFPFKSINHSLERHSLFKKIHQTTTEHLHHSGILYCDLKPSNVLIDEYGVLKLCDFGLARSIPTDQDDVQATKRGTPCYMAPELFTDDGVYSCASDLWALGCILYEMVVGVPPFVSNSFEDLVNMVLTSPVPKPAIGNDGSVVRLSKSLRHLLEGAFSKN
jgi:serine/threonine protein kinase